MGQLETYDVLNLFQDDSLDLYADSRCIYYLIQEWG